MKLNKKIAVPFLSTVMGLSLIGGVGGAVAWYQYNSRVTASFIGTSVADSTVLQIGTKASANAEITWGRDVVSGTENSNKLTPVTFGALNDNDALPSQAYAYPEAGDGAYTTGWAQASAGKEYVQFEIYLRALAPNGTESSGYKQAVRDVYLSQVVLEDATDGKDVSGALRVHLGVEGEGNTNRLISETKVTGLALSGELDLDGDGALDKPGGYAWEQNPSAANITYGKAGDTQDTLGITDIVQERDANGYMPETANSKLICKTPLSGEQKIVITVWLEGWAELGASAPKALWNANKTAAAAVHVGLRFDVGRPRPAN